MNEGVWDMPDDVNATLRKIAESQIRMEGVINEKFARLEGSIETDKATTELKVKDLDRRMTLFEQSQRNTRQTIKTEVIKWVMQSLIFGGSLAAILQLVQ